MPDAAPLHFDSSSDSNSDYSRKRRLDSDDDEGHDTRRRRLSPPPSPAALDRSSRKSRYQGVYSAMATVVTASSRAFGSNVSRDIPIRSLDHVGPSPGSASRSPTRVFGFSDVFQLSDVSQHFRTRSPTLHAFPISAVCSGIHPGTLRIRCRRR